MKAFICLLVLSISSFSLAQQIDTIEAVIQVSAEAQAEDCLEQISVIMTKDGLANTFNFGQEVLDLGPSILKHSSNPVIFSAYIYPQTKVAIESLACVESIQF